MNINKFSIIKIIITISVAISTYFLSFSGFLLSTSNRIADMLYQRGNVQSGNVVIVGIDEHTLDELGPYQYWTRDYVADAIEYLNGDEELSPDVIGVDILYVGYSNEESDQHLVRAASLQNNIVWGSYLNFDNVLTDNNGAYGIESKVTLYEEPFDELLATSTDGFVNGFYDEDGIVRHGLQSINVYEDSLANSFSYEIYSKYSDINGINNTLNIPANANGLWYIDYTDSPGGYDNSFSLSDLIQGEIPIEYFTDKIVLIGPYADAMMDGYPTSIYHGGEMYGVEIHANMIEAMLDGRLKHELSRNILAVLTVIITLGALYYGYKDNILRSIIYACVFIIIYPILCILLYKNGLVLNPFFIPASVFIITVFVVIAHYIRVLLEKRKVENTFKRYVAPEIVNDIMEHGLSNIALGGQAVDCAILFVDIRGFTTMSEQLEPEEVVSILNRYLELTSSSIFKYGGTLDKFIGDATMAIFNAPIPMEDYIYKAVCAAWDMVERSHELEKELLDKFGRSVSFGVGVHCGKAVVGNIGTHRRMDYTAIGDTVNTSARLEANAPKDTVYISDKVYEALKGRIECESIGPLSLKGKNQNIEVYKLKGITG